MLKRLMLFGVLALALAAPAQAEGWKELRVRGVVVSVSAEVVTVENLVGDAMLKCRVPERLAEKAASFKAGDKVRMVCARKRGERALLVKLEPLAEREAGEKPKGERGETAEHRQGDRHDKADHAKPEHVQGDKHDRADHAKPEHVQGDKHDQGEHTKGEQGEKPEHPVKPEKPTEAAARGSVAELGPNAIVVQDAESNRRLACRVSAEKAHKLEGVKVGDRVKIACLNGELVYLERAEAAEVKLYGTISALSATSVSVTGDGRTLTCSAPSGFAEKLGRFAVGNSVKMMCRGTELTYLEKV